ncbi:GtrA family protein [Streptomyces albiaxialis]|uniref:GtrA family protein n=1 Tax=Streptomyces albiaxialis TaxID=329523 RepID=A0ABN2WFQ2_9ACTN
MTARPARAPRTLRGELAGFALAGICAYGADVGLFVWLRGPQGMDPLAAKALSFVAGCVVAYTGNALGPYRTGRTGDGRTGACRTGDGRTGGGWRRFCVFFLVNVAGAAVQLACLGVSHYGLGLTSARADVVAGSGVGMALATVLRFWGTRTLVFGSASGPGATSRPRPSLRRRTASGRRRRPPAAPASR